MVNTPDKMSEIVSNRPESERVLTSLKPVVEMVIIVIYSASINPNPSIIIYSTVPITTMKESNRIP